MALGYSGTMLCLGFLGSLCTAMLYGKDWLCNAVHTLVIMDHKGREIATIAHEYDSDESDGHKEIREIAATDDDSEETDGKDNTTGDSDDSYGKQEKRAKRDKKKKKSMRKKSKGEKKREKDSGGSD